MAEKFREYQIDVVLLQETNYRWNSHGEEKLKRKMKTVNKKTWLNGTDSSETYRTSWLPKGTIAIVWGELTGMIMPNSNYNDGKG